MATDDGVGGLELGENLKVHEFEVQIGVATRILTTLVIPIMNPFA